jgi:hypothetical protein
MRAERVDARLAGRARDGADAARALHAHVRRRGAVEPQPAGRAPDGKYVLFTLGDGWAQNGPPYNCTAAVVKDHGAAPARARGADVGNCTPVAEPSNCDPAPCLRCNITLHVADAPGAQGPWTPYPTAIIGLSADDTIVRSGARPGARPRARARTPRADPLPPCSAIGIPPQLSSRTDRSPS